MLSAVVNGSAVVVSDTDGHCLHGSHAPLGRAFAAVAVVDSASVLLLTRLNGGCSGSGSGWAVRRWVVGSPLETTCETPLP